MSDRIDDADSNILCEYLADSSHDFFGYDNLAKDVARQLRKEKAPFVYAICGKWGSGKSSFIINLVNHLPKPEDGSVVVYFNAWQGVVHDDILASFINELIEQICIALPDVSKEIKSASSVLLKAVIAAFSDANSYAKFFTSLFEHIYATRSKEPRKIISPKAELRESFENIGRILSRRKITVYVIIDELDRCPPTIAVNMVETLRMIFSANDELLESISVHNSISRKESNSNIPFKYVLSIDEQYLSRSFSQVYGMETSESHDYLTKFIQFKYHFPEKNWKTYVIETVKGEPDNSPWLPQGTIDDLVTIFEFLEVTPREANRMFAYFLEWQTIHYKRLLKSVPSSSGDEDTIIRTVNICLFLYAYVKVVRPLLVRWCLRNEVFNCLLDTERMEHIMNDVNKNELTGELLVTFGKCIPVVEEIVNTKTSSRPILDSINSLLSEFYKT